MTNSRTRVLYEVRLKGLVLTLDGGDSFDATHLLGNGRANYILFENFVAQCAGLRPNSQGGASDLVDSSGKGYEVKSYRDPALHPDPRHDLFHTAASSTFGPNNHGPTINRLLREGKYEEALQICMDSGYSKNAFYIYLNTAQYKVEVPLRYMIVPTSDVLRLISSRDPRQISRTALLDLAKEKIQI